MADQKSTDKTVNETAKALGNFLKTARGRIELTLRAVEDATDKEVSNGYLSQLENGKISKPSPHVLHALSAVYSLDYSDVMKRAGYISPTAQQAEGQKHGRAATFAIENLSGEEEKELMNYLSYMRSRRKD